MYKEQLPHPNTRMNAVLHSLHFLGDSHDPQFPLANVTNANVRKMGGKNHRVYMKKSTDCPCFLVLIPSHFLSLLYPNALHVLIEYGITVAGFQKTSKPKAVMHFVNSIQVVYYLMISNTILVYTRENRFTFDGLQNFH